MSVRLTATGAYTVKCFQGCSTDEILGAIGLNRNDLFPNKIGSRSYAPRLPRETLVTRLYEAIIHIKEGRQKSAIRILADLADEVQ
jgi:hypothetical protein